MSRHRLALFSSASRFAGSSAVLDDLDPPRGPVKSFTEIEADFRAASKTVPPTVALFAEAERGGFDEAQLAGLRVVWRSRKVC